MKGLVPADRPDATPLVDAMPRADATPLAAEEIRQLVSIGFHGVLNGKVDEARRLFEQLAVLRPGEGFPHIGTALALAAMGRPDEAAAVLEKVLAQRPDDDEVRVFLGMMLRLARRDHHARTVLAALSGRDGETPAHRLARSLTAPARAAVP